MTDFMYLWMTTCDFLTIGILLYLLASETRKLRHLKSELNETEGRVNFSMGDSRQEDVGDTSHGLQVSENSFGSYYRFTVPKGCDVVIVGTLEGQFRPRSIHLPHQVSVAAIHRMLSDCPGATGWAVYPASSEGRVLCETRQPPNPSGSGRATARRA